MIIKRMTAWFGALDGKSLALGGGLNVLYAPNESGKSTWCAFLRAMLYGVDTSQRAKDGRQPDKVRYQPWSGVPMSGSMDVETADGLVTLRRWTERNGQPMQEFSATVSGTDAAVPDMTGPEAGRILTGAPREVFERSAFIHQAGLELTNDPELEKRFAAIVSAGDEEQSYTEADKRLRAWMRQRRSGKRGAIPETEGQIARVKGELAQTEDAAQAMERLEQELSQAQQTQGELVRKMETARAEARKRALGELSAAKAAVSACGDALRQAEEDASRAVDALKGTAFGVMGPDRAERQAAEDTDAADALADAADRLPHRWPVVIPMALGLLLLVLAPFTAATVALLAGGLVMFCLAAGLYFWRKNVEKRRDDLLDQRMEILDGYGAADTAGIAAALEEYKSMCRDAKEAAGRVTEAQRGLESARLKQKAAEEPVLNGLDFVNGDSEAARASRAVAEGQERLDRLREQRAIAEGRVRAVGDPVVLRSELEELERRREELLVQERALALAAETMEQADLGLREKFSPVLARRAAALFGRLTGGRYDEITLARDLSAKARLAGEAVGRESGYLSQGARDQLYLALRLAVCELVLPEEQACPIILDDALMAFDQTRMERALDLLRELSEKRQILLFTCHEREMEYLAGEPTVTKIAL